MTTRGNAVIGKKQITFLLSLEAVGKARWRAHEEGISKSIHLERLIEGSLSRWEREKPDLPRYRGGLEYLGMERLQVYLSLGVIRRMKEIALSLDCSLSSLAEDAIQG